MPIAFVSVPATQVATQPATPVDTDTAPAIEEVLPQPAATDPDAAQSGSLSGEPVLSPPNYPHPSLVGLVEHSVPRNPGSLIQYFLQQGGYSAYMFQGFERLPLHPLSVLEGCAAYPLSHRFRVFQNLTWRPEKAAPPVLLAEDIHHDSVGTASARGEDNALIIHLAVESIAGVVGRVARQVC